MRNNVHEGLLECTEAEVVSKEWKIHGWGGVGDNVSGKTSILLAWWQKDLPPSSPTRPQHRLKWTERLFPVSCAAGRKPRTWYRGYFCARTTSAFLTASMQSSIVCKAKKTAAWELATGPETSVQRWPTTRIADRECHHTHWTWFFFQDYEKESIRVTFFLTCYCGCVLHK